MTDEEKKAMEDLKEISHYCSLRAIDIEDKYSDTWAEYVVSIQKVFNLIEKQSKEIEELKEEYNTKLLSNAGIYQLGFNDGEKSVKDKIKAKIEPVLKQLDTKMEEEYNKYGNSREYQDIVDAYNFLQSLLEKE